MNIIVTGRNVEVTPSLKKYAEEKIGRFDKYLSNISEAVVTFSIQRHNHKTEVLLKVNGTNLQAEGVTNELYSSIDEVVDKLDKQIKKLKGKITSRRKSAEQPAALMETVEAAPAESKRIIPVKVESMKPMSPEEASMQIELDNRDFMVFINSQTSSVNVIFQMNDGNFGLIEPGQ